MAEPALDVRSDLLQVDPYVSPQAPARYRMNTNESPYPPPQALVDEVAEEIKSIALNRYPDRDANRLYDAISTHVKWPRDGLWVANGSNEVFMHLLLAFGGPGRTAMVFEPTYALHSLIPRIAGSEVLTVGRGVDLHVDVDRARDEIEKHSPEIVIVCSPNNPTGDTESPATIEALLDVAPGLVVVDEAYIEFAGAGESITPLLAERPNLVVTKTFSKAWRLAGVRIGYMLAAAELVQTLARVRLPYHLSAITQVVGEAAIRHSTETLDLVRAIASERDRIASGLQDLGIHCFPSRANFVLFRVDDAPRVWDALVERDILIRRYDEVRGLEGCLRVTAGLPEESDVFLGAMKEICDV
jgi:histidinol-phosphate aminotransferase